MRGLDITEYGRRTLEDVLRAGPLPAAAALDVLRDVAEELRAAWEERAEAHGDLKPWTVEVLPDGHATVTGEPLAGASRRGDAYWFAILAIELLTGTRPIERVDAACLLRGTPGFPPEARQALLTGLSPRPKRRPLPHQLVAALEAVPASAWTGEEQPAAPAEPDEPTEPTEPPEPDGAAEGDAPSGLEEPPQEPAAVVRPEPEPAVRRSLARRLGPYVAALCLLAVPAAGGTGAWMLGLLPTSAEGAATSSVAVESASLTVTPPTTHCPRATVQLDTTVTTNGEAGTLRLVFWLPGGNRLHERTVHVDEGQTVARAVAEITVAGEVRLLRGDASVTIHPGGRRAFAPFRYDC